MSIPLAKLVEVDRSGEGEYSSKLVSLVDREPGALLAKIEGWKLAEDRAYTSVQISEDHDIELNSDLVYCNHSCEPSVIFDTVKFEVRVVPDRALKRGDDITFFYPSTEWDMEQPFQCQCGSENCLKTVDGARYLDETKIGNYWLNPHIKRALSSRTKN